ncbi:MAG: hypothetical protein HKN30_12475 [Sulfitobacter sp.]|nr:hypothetical protein [Sulfitobacter sp.]
MVKIAFAPPEEREEIAQFMNTCFHKAKWGIDIWRRLLSGRWSGDDPRYAITVRDGRRLVGVLGMIPVMRDTPKGPRRAIGLTSWYMMKELRGQGAGAKMMALASQNPDDTVTNFTSAKAAVPLVFRIGFEAIDEKRLIWHPHPDAGFRVHEDPLALGGRLSPIEQKIIADHAGLGLRFCTVETPDGLCTVVLNPKRKHDAYVTHEVMYLGNQPLFAHYSRQIAGAVLPQRDAILSLDSRFGAKGVAPDEEGPLEVPRFAFRGLQEPSEIDLLYTECVLLPVKLP